MPLVFIEGCRRLTSSLDVCPDNSCSVPVAQHPPAPSFKLASPTKPISEPIEIILPSPCTIFTPTIVHIARCIAKNCSSSLLRRLPRLKAEDARACGELGPASSLDLLAWNFNDHVPDPALLIGSEKQSQTTLLGFLPSPKARSPAKQRQSISPRCLVGAKPANGCWAKACLSFSAGLIAIALESRFGSTVLYTD